MNFVYLYHTWGLISRVTQYAQHNPACCLLSGVIISSAPFHTQKWTMNYMMTKSMNQSLLVSYNISFYFNQSNLLGPLRLIHLHSWVDSGQFRPSSVSPCLGHIQLRIKQILVVHSPAGRKSRICSQPNLLSNTTP